MARGRAVEGGGGPRTFHMLAADRWAAWRDGPSDALYEPDGYATDGFVHCTDGDEAMVATANRFYRELPGEFLLLTLDLDRTGSPWRFDDPGQRYPHVYGPIEPASVMEVRRFTRAADGTFTGIIAR